MSQITVVFKDYEEMKRFAKELLKGESLGPQPETEKAVTPVQSSVQQAPTAYGQQIAVHFPAANTGQAPVQQQATPVQQQTAPVQQQPAPVQQQTAPVQQAPVQSTAPSYKMDDLSNAAMQLMDKGMQAQLLQLISQFGVDALPQLPPEQYGNFATALRGLGAQI
jgi:FtsZ-interacting cell division protein ZipA